MIRNNLKSGQIAMEFLFVIGLILFLSMTVNVYAEFSIFRFLLVSLCKTQIIMNFQWISWISWNPGHVFSRNSWIWLIFKWFRVLAEGHQNSSWIPNEFHDPGDFLKIMDSIGLHELLFVSYEDYRQPIRSCEIN